MNEKTLLISNATGKRFYIERIDGDDSSRIFFSGFVDVHGNILEIFNKSGSWINVGSNIDYRNNFFVENGNLYGCAKANNGEIIVHWTE